MATGLKTLANKAKKDLKSTQNLKDLESVFRLYLGRKGEVTTILRSLSKLPQKDRVRTGKAANELRKLLEGIYKEHKQSLSNAEEGRGEWLDVTAPGTKMQKGHLHPLTQTRRRAEAIFGSMGFAVAQGPKVEDEWHNFDALNIPQEHPARDLWDTFWLKETIKGKPLLLRTHTSPVQVRYMETHQPPLRIIVPGSVFRYEATDASHEFELMQLEGLMVGKEVSVANFKSVIQEFYKEFFKSSVKIRLRTSYFPFVEPGFEVDMSCIVCEGKGCASCGKSGWLEMMGAGMVHPHVFKAVGYNPKNWQGFAFGMGLDRLAMMRYKIPDIRLFRSGDLRVLTQF